MSIHKTIGLFLLMSIQGFSQQITDTLIFPKIQSSVVMPIRIPLSELNTTANLSVGDLIYQDDSYTDNNNDQFKVKVWKNGAIKLYGGKSQNLIIEVPVKVWAEKGIGTLGMYTYQNTTFETTMYFNTSLAFNPNWTVKTTTQSAGFKWVTKPTLDFGRIKVPITPLVENSLKEQQAGFGSIIDQQLSSKLNFKPYVLSALNLLSEPTNISEEYNTWLKISAIRANMTPFVFYSNAIDLNLGIDVYSETFTGFRPSNSPAVTTIPNLNFVKELPSSFNLKTTANIPYSKATELARKTFLHREFDFRDGKSKIKINGIKVYAEDQRLVIEAQTVGDITGTSLISGIPVYSPEKRKIVLSNTNFKLRTKNILQKTASLLFKGKITRMIEEEYGIPTQEIEETSKKSIESAFNKSYNGSIKVSGKVNALYPSRIVVGNNGLTAVIDTNASLRILISGM